MRLSTFTATATATLLAASLPSVRGCAVHSNATTGEQFQLGNNGPADSDVLGYGINHFALNVNDLGVAMHFYGKVLGMRHIFTYEVSPMLELVYLGYSTGGKNGTGFQTGEELYKQKDNTAGLVELLHRKDCNGTAPAGEPLQPSTRKPNTFCHVGLVVPDIMAAQERMERFNVTILKPVGVDPAPKGPIANAFGVGDVPDDAADEIMAGLEGIGFKYVLIVEDPDGNIVEIYEQK